MVTHYMPACLHEVAVEECGPPELHKILSSQCGSHNNNLILVDVALPTIT